MAWREWLREAAETGYYNALSPETEENEDD
jgi:hypothetical protein